MASRTSIFRHVGLEERIRDHVRSHDLHRAATLAIESYGPEVLGFLATTLGDELDAEEVFAQTAEDLWRGLERFQFRCSMRTWMYVLARHAAARHLRPAHRRHERPASTGELERVVERVRSRTMPWLRTELKDGIAELRASLAPDDRALLVLRVDRGLSWLEVARVLSEDPDPEPAHLATVSARLRKRFQTLKEEIRRRAKDAGLLQ